MSKSNSFKTDLLLNIFNKINFSWEEEKDFYISLHINEPTDGTQTNNEANYSNYSRQKIGRTEKDWEVIGSKVVNKKKVEFPVCIAGMKEITYISIGLKKSGDGEIIYSGKLSEKLIVKTNIRPEFPIGTIVIMEK